APPGASAPLVAASLIAQVQGVTCDHQFLVGRDDPGSDPTARGADAGPPARIGSFVQIQPEPGGVAADARADRGRVLANPGREHQAVEAAQGRRQGAEFAADPVNQQVERLGRPGVGAGLIHPSSFILHPSKRALFTIRWASATMLSRWAWSLKLSA